MHLLAQPPAASFWQVIGHIFNIQPHERDFPTWAKTSFWEQGMCLQGCPMAVWRGWAGGLAWPLGAVKAAKISTLPPRLGAGHSAQAERDPVAARRAVPALCSVLPKGAACRHHQERTCPACSVTASTEGLGREIKSEFGFQGSL